MPSKQDKEPKDDSGSFSFEGWNDASVPASTAPPTAPPVVALSSYSSSATAPPINNATRVAAISSHLRHNIKDWVTETTTNHPTTVGSLMLTMAALLILVVSCVCCYCCCCTCRSCRRRRQPAPSKAASTTRTAKTDDESSISTFFSRRH